METKEELKEDKEESKENVIFGCPPAVLLGAKAYKFKTVADNISITVKRSGNYNEIAPEVFNKESGSFDLLAHTKDGDVLFMPSITKVLFAEHKYPKLEGNQVFVLTALIFKEEFVQICGTIIEFLQN